MAAAFPFSVGGSAPAKFVFGACSTFTHVTARTLAESLNDPFPLGASTWKLPAKPPELLPARMTKLPGGIRTHGKPAPLHGAQHGINTEKDKQARYGLRIFPYYKRFISLLPATIFSRCLQQFFGVGGAGTQQGGDRLATGVRHLVTVFFAYLLDHAVRPQQPHLTSHR